MDEVGSTRSATSSAVSPLLCDWTTGDLSKIFLTVFDECALGHA
jgi:hypothetical protein